MDTQICITCDQEKEMKEFNKRSSTTWKPICRECEKARRKMKLLSAKISEEIEERKKLLKKC